MYTAYCARLCSREPDPQLLIHDNALSRPSIAPVDHHYAKAISNDNYVIAHQVIKLHFACAGIIEICDDVVRYSVIDHPTPIVWSTQRIGKDHVGD